MIRTAILTEPEGFPDISRRVEHPQRTRRVHSDWVRVSTKNPVGFAAISRGSIAVGLLRSPNPKGSQPLASRSSAARPPDRVPVALVEPKGFPAISRRSSIARPPVTVRVVTPRTRQGSQRLLPRRPPRRPPRSGATSARPQVRSDFGRRSGVSSPAVCHWRPASASFAACHWRPASASYASGCGQHAGGT